MNWIFTHINKPKDQQTVFVAKAAWSGEGWFWHTSLGVYLKKIDTLEDWTNVTEDRVPFDFDMWCPANPPIKAKDYAKMAMRDK